MMVKPLTMADIGQFLEMCLYAFDDYIVFSFIIMVTFAVIMGIRQVLYWGY